MVFFPGFSWFLATWLETHPPNLSTSQPSVEETHAAPRGSQQSKPTTQKLAVRWSFRPRWGRLVVTKSRPFKRSESIYEEACEMEDDRLIFFSLQEDMTIRKEKSGSQKYQVVYFGVTQRLNTGATQ